MDINTSIESYFEEWYGSSQGRGWGAILRKKPIRMATSMSYRPRFFTLKNRYETLKMDRSIWTMIEVTISFYQSVVMNKEFIPDHEIAYLLRDVEFSMLLFTTRLIGNESRDRFFQIANILHRIVGGCEGETK